MTPFAVRETAESQTGCGDEFPARASYAKGGRVDEFWDGSGTCEVVAFTTVARTVV